MHISRATTRSAPRVLRCTHSFSHARNTRPPSSSSSRCTSFRSGRRRPCSPCRLCGGWPRRRWPRCCTWLLCSPCRLLPPRTTCRCCCGRGCCRGSTVVPALDKAEALPGLPPVLGLLARWLHPDPSLQRRALCRPKGQMPLPHLRTRRRRCRPVRPVAVLGGDDLVPDGGTHRHGGLGRAEVPHLTCIIRRCAESLPGTDEPVRTCRCRESSSDHGGAGRKWPRACE